ncbi:nucleoside hydrolase [Sporolactobacillus putidus]|uniref:Inosine-uridine preferring nucleoside hydrolase n=1 Tax=Sporolactobacillus putidus TaxID=492735 RepID=A0A917W372_9BACL|nr:nucleoside hydrolase [Sporolactobacillus putidus]GGL56997.1 inosine-uridine preferring nucleoside hydrolase [Sporolactobacillus putidus]
MDKKALYFIHDADVDDLVSLFLLTQMENISLSGVSVIPADGYLTPGIEASRKIIDRFGRETVEVARSNSRGMNPFPKEWRMRSFYVNALPILNESGDMKTPVSALHGHEHLIQQARNADEPLTILCTGPLSDVARALDQAPDIEEKIDQLIWMGGTLNPIGNVQEPEHDGSAEWNAFWDPEAVARVWQSSLNIRMVALESTNQVPLTIPIRNHWASLRKYDGLDFIGQCYASVPPLVHFENNATYYLWDVLTTMASGNPDLVKTKKVLTKVHVEEPSQGKIEAAEDGRPVEVVYDVDREAFFESIIDLAKKA